jgi:hypothetical protein
MGRRGFFSKAERHMNIFQKGLLQGKSNELTKLYNLIRSFRKLLGIQSQAPDPSACKPAEKLVLSTLRVAIANG